MNDDQFEALDDRASNAARNVQAAAGRRPRPAFDADRPMTLPQPAAVGESRGPRRTAWVAAAAVVALVAGAVTFAATRPEGGKDTIAASSVDDPRPFVAEYLPDGFEPATFMDLATDRVSEESLASAMPVYGITIDQPMAGATVIDGPTFEEAIDLDSFDDDGVTFYRNAGEEFLAGTWVLVKQDATAILVFGATEDDALALAHTVSAMDGAVVVDGDRLPEGWRRLVTVDDPMAEMFMTPTGAPVKGYFSAYVANEMYKGMQVTSVSGDEASMWAGRLFAPDAREVTVRGQRGFIEVSDIDLEVIDTSASETKTKGTVSWLERPGEVLTVTGIDVTEDELLAVAEGIRPATEEEWADLIRQSQLGAFDGDGASDSDQGPDTQLGRTTGTFDDGTSWALVIVQSAPYEDGRLPDGELAEGDVYTDLRVAVGSDQPEGAGFASSSGSSSSSSDGVQAFRSVDTTDIAGRHFSSGIVGDEVASVQLQRTDGTVLSDAIIVEVAGYTAFVTELTEEPTVLVALRADGAEVGRVTIEDLDQNTTTDMDGDGSFSGQGTPIDSDGNPIVDPVQPTATTVPTDDTVPD